MPAQRPLAKARGVTHRALRRQAGIRVPGKVAGGSLSSGASISKNGPLLNGIKKRINGNATNGKSYEIGNVLEATLLSLLQGAILVISELLQGAIPSLLFMYEAGSDP